jgi:hypothetical protein
VEAVHTVFFGYHFEPPRSVRLFMPELGEGRGKAKGKHEKLRLGASAPNPFLVVGPGAVSPFDQLAVNKT